MAAEFKSELPEDVGVETVTIMGFSDGRPSEMVMAGTSNETVKHVKMNAKGEQLTSAYLAQMFLFGIAGAAD